MLRLEANTRATGDEAGSDIDDKDLEGIEVSNREIQILLDNIQEGVEDEADIPHFRNSLESNPEAIASMRKMIQRSKYREMTGKK
jgi:hypothetical protein